MRRNKERAHRALRQTGGVHGDASPLPFGAANHAAGAPFRQTGAVDGLVVETLQKTIQGGEVGHTQPTPTPGAIRDARPNAPRLHERSSLRNASGREMANNCGWVN